MNALLFALIHTDPPSLVFPVVKWLFLVTTKRSNTFFRSLPSCPVWLWGLCVHTGSLVMNEPCRGQLPSASHQKHIPQSSALGQRQSEPTKTIPIIHLTLKQYLLPLNIYFGTMILKNIIYASPVGSHSFNRSNSSASYS